MEKFYRKPLLSLTQLRGYVPYGTCPNFCFAKTSFMLETLGEIRLLVK